MKLLRSTLGKTLLRVAAVLVAGFFVSCEQWVLFDSDDGIHRYSPYQRRIPLEIDPAGGPGRGVWEPPEQDLIDFPVHVTVDETGLGDPALFFARRSDFRFFEEAGRPLAVEVVEWPDGQELSAGVSVPTAEKARLWVRFPRWEKTSLSRIWLYDAYDLGWSAPKPPEQPSFREVWSTGYGGVDHLDEPALRPVTLSVRLSRTVPGPLSAEYGALFDRGGYDLHRQENGRFYGRAISLDDDSVNREWPRERRSGNSSVSWKYVAISWTGEMDEPGGDASELLRLSINGTEIVESDAAADQVSPEFLAIKAGVVSWDVEAPFTLTDL